MVIKKFLDLVWFDIVFDRELVDYLGEPNNSTELR